MINFYIEWAQQTMPLAAVQPHRAPYQRGRVRFVYGGFWAASKLQACNIREVSHVGIGWASTMLPSR